MQQPMDEELHTTEEWEVNQEKLQTMQQPMDEELHTTEEWEVNQEMLQAMKRKTDNPPKLLTRAACSIFRVPQSVKDSNCDSYEPQAVSIGPYHRSDPNLNMIEEHKWAYLGAMLRRLGPSVVSLEDLVKAVRSLEARARECYSEEISMTSDEFIEMMILDGCFILELFRRSTRSVESKDPMHSNTWVSYSLRRDLIKLENQIPLFVLRRLFTLTREGKESSTSLTSLALEFFSMGRNVEVIISKLSGLDCKHLLDLIRASYVKSSSSEAQGSEKDKDSPLICSLSKLRRSGIEIKRVSAESFLDVSFKGGILHMPEITITGFMSSFLLNCVAYEQCHSVESDYFTTYVTFLDCLVNSGRDVEYLCDKKIFRNYFGSDAELAKFINSMGNEMVVDIPSSYLSEMFAEVDKYYTNNWHVQVASFKYTYFNTPWSLISALAAGVLLLLTVAQTFFTIYGVYHK